MGSVLRRVSCTVSPGPRLTRMGSLLAAASWEVTHNGATALDVTSGALGPGVSCGLWTWARGLRTPVTRIPGRGHRLPTPVSPETVTLFSVGSAVGGGRL